MTEQAADGTSAPYLGEPEVTAIAEKPSRRINTRGLTLRGFAARGMLINTVFDTGLQGLSLVRGFLLAALLSRSDYGVWGVLGVTLGVLSRLKVVGVSDKYMQQDESDQVLAFQQAFTMEAIVTGLSMVPLLIALPIIGVIYGHWSILAPGLVVIMALPATPFSASQWVFYRRMDFARARWLQALDPVSSFVVTVGLAIAGAGYWSFVGGLLAGAWASAIGSAIKSPYPFRWRYDPSVMRVYRTYTMPLLMSTLAAIVLANSASLAINVKLGLAGVGVLALASNITSFATNVDDIVSGTVYPAICAAQDRLDLLRESFEKANRIALMWAMPFGVGLALFCGYLVRYALGSKWAPAIPLLQITGLVVAVGHIGFNWDDYMRARADTKPIGIVAGAAAVAFVVVGVPLTLAFGLRGLGLGIAVQALVSLSLRAYFVTRMFQGFAFARHALRALLITAPATGLTLLLRAATPGPPDLLGAIASMLLFVIVTMTTTYLIEGALLREAMGYVFEQRRARAAA
jgi:O-antigen/teichoic acid export membrane protein